MPLSVTSPTMVRPCAALVVLEAKQQLVVEGVVAALDAECDDREPGVMHTRYRRAILPLLPPVGRVRRMPRWLSLNMRAQNQALNGATFLRLVGNTCDVAIAF